MKKNIFLLILMFVFAAIIYAQNDTMYIMKNGDIIGKYNVKTQLDSIIFYRPKEKPKEIVLDVDGNTYNTVTIGTQIWLAENLKTTHYTDGTPIQKVIGHAYWDTLKVTDAAYCWYVDDSATYAATYGALYTWEVVNTNKLCPKGWSVPTDFQWTDLEIYLKVNGYNFDGSTSGNKIAKSLAAISDWIENGTIGAIGNNISDNNSTGFSAVPGGYRANHGINDDGSCSGLGYYAMWWCSSEFSSTTAYKRSLYSYNFKLSRSNSPKTFGFSVRCIKD